jgi:predicted ribosome quality control (RQC) complex YloA/Tae2 family protein
MQRGIASFDIYVIVSELQDLIGCYIEKIYQLSRDEILIKVQQKTANQKESLFIRNGQLLCRTQQSFDTPEKPSLFAMTLRKYLLNGKISQITQHEFDRIIQIKIGRKEGEYTIVCELFSKGNILLLNPEGRIIRPLIKQEWASRIIKSGELYLPPPSQTNPFQITKQTLHDLLLKSSKDLVRTLATSVNLSGLYAEELCARAYIDKEKKASELTEQNIERLYDELHHLLMIFEEKKFQPMYVKKQNIITDILPFRFTSYTDVTYEEIPSFSKGLELFIKGKETPKPQEIKYQKKRDKLQRQLTQQHHLVEEFKKNIAQKKLEADLIYMNYQAIDTVLTEITALLQEKEKQDSINRIRQYPFVKQFDPTANELIMELPDIKKNGIEISLDFRKSVAENAQYRYEESKKSQEKLKGAQDAIEQTKKDLDTIQEIKIVEKKKEEKQKKLWWFERFRWFLSTEGNIIVAGKDAQSNDLVVKKYLTEGDRYAHADIHGAPSCVIKSKGINDEPLPISEKTFEEACVFAASYSRAWNQFAEASAYWVLPEQVSKTPQSGEYVPKGAFIIRGKRNYQRCKLQIAVGLISVDGEEKLMGGPLTAVAAHATHGYVIISPGTTKKSNVARMLAKAFTVSTETAEKVLPPGDCTIIQTIGIELS